MRVKPTKHAGKWSPPSKKWLEEQHLTLGKSPSQIAEEIGTSPSRVKRWLKASRVLKKLRYSDTVTEEGAPKVQANDHSWFPPTADWLWDKYVEGLTPAEVAKEIGASTSTVVLWYMDI